MMMQHWMSWQEIIAQAYLFEEKSIGKKKHNRSSSTPTSPVQKRKKRSVSDFYRSLFLEQYFLDECFRLKMRIYTGSLTCYIPVLWKWYSVYGTDLHTPNHD